MKRWSWFEDGPRGVALMGIALVVIVVLLGLFKLGSMVVHSFTRHHAQEGIVIALDYNPVSITVYPPSTSCAGSPPTCITTPGSTVVIPENWNVRVVDDTGTEDWHEVDRYVYEGCAVGQYWPGEDGACRPAA